MFKDLDWRWAFKRAGFVVLIYLVLMYILSTVAPDRFELNTANQWRALLINAVLFFFVFTFVYAFIERSRRQRMAGTSQQPKKKTDKQDDSEPGPLRGKPNPNTSRKKATRRRR